MNILKEKVLVAESQGREIREVLLGLDYEIVECPSFESVIQGLKRDPSLIIGDFLSFEKSLKDVCEHLKKNFQIQNIPLIVVSEKLETQEKISISESGASDYIEKPFQKEEIQARINRSVRDMKQALNANPLTRLPGNILIKETLEKLVREGKNFAVAYFDVDNFKAYNDTYGYAKGDEVLANTASLILNCSEEFQNARENIFTGHVGGDDFLMICPEDLVESFCRRYISLFDEKAPHWYDPDTAKRGFLLGKDRSGKSAVFPLVSISIAVVVNDQQKKFQHVGEIASSASEIKKYLKSFPGSSFLVERRNEPHA